MPTVGSTSKPAYVYDAGSDTWIPIGPGEHSHAYIPNTLVDAKGDILTATAADTPARLAAGTNGQYLSSNSSTATGLEWVTASSGGMTLINSGGTTLTGASVSISSIPATYKNLQLIVRNFRPATDTTSLLMRINGDTGANRHAYHLNNRTNNVIFDATSIKILEDVDSGASQSLAQMDFYDYANATTWKSGFGLCINNNTTTTTNFNFQMTGWVYNQTGAISSIDLFPSSGNFTSGTAFLYGVS